METVAVLGSNSFSGSHFAHGALQSGFRVLAISRSPEPHHAFLPYRWSSGGQHAAHLTFHQLDLNTDSARMADLIRQEQCAYVVNFAAQSMVAESWEHPEHWYQTNILANVRLHDQLRKMDCLKRYVHVSTPEVYGNCEGPIAEDHPMSPSTPYAASRAACDMHLKTFHDRYDFPVVFTRAANVYGPGQQLYRIIPRTILCAMDGKTLMLHGGGTSVRSFIHIRDVVDATLSIMRAGTPPNIFHLSTDRFLSIRELVTMIAESLDVSFDSFVKVSDERPGKDHAYILDSTKAHETFAWKPKIALEAGVKETVDWVTEYIDALRKQPQSYIHKP